MGNLICIVVLLVSLLITILRYRYIIEQKNKAMAHQIDQYLAKSGHYRKLKDENYELREYVRVLQEEIKKLQNVKEEELAEELKQLKVLQENKELFEKLDHAIVNDRLYLEPHLTREKLLKIIHVDKNRFAQIINQNAKTNLSGYINGLRLEYAVKMLGEQPNCLIQSIAIESGIPNSGTFYRLFREQYGITPAEYRIATQDVDI